MTALNEVTVLVMKTADFASFISAHPRVLEVVENQIYDRLIENPEGYAQDDWPAARVPPALRRQLRVRPQPEPTGQNCTAPLTDVVGFGALDRTDHDRAIIRREGLEMMQASLGPLWDACISQDRGDGLLVVAPPSIPTAEIIGSVNEELPRRLRLHNRTYSTSARIHLRVAAHVGPIIGDLLGLSGGTIIRTARMVEAPVLKEAMTATAAGLGSWFPSSSTKSPSPMPLISSTPPSTSGSRSATRNSRGSAWMRLVDVSPMVRDSSDTA